MIYFVCHRFIKTNTPNQDCSVTKFTEEEISNQALRIENGWRTKSIVSFSRGILGGFTRMPP